LEIGVAWYVVGMEQQLKKTLCLIEGLEEQIALYWQLVGRQLYCARLETGMSLRAAAMHAGVDHAHVYHIEKGTKRGSPEVMDRLIAVLDDPPPDVPAEQ
jgi:hypothetical protein